VDVIEGLPSGAWALLGLELWGDPPLGHVRLPLIPDRISVLYGLNGAGKSTVLAAVRSALRGTCDEAPFLRRFRIHAELREPERDDPIMSYVAMMLRRLSRGAGSGPGREESSAPNIGRRGPPSASDALGIHLERITGDPCCTPALAEGLSLPDQARVPLRVVVTGHDRGIVSIALAGRPDGTSFSLMSRLLAQEAASDPTDQVVLGSPMHIVWEAITRAIDQRAPHSVFHPGPQNIAELERITGSDAAAVQRALVERWVSDWLFAGEFPAVARMPRPLERWQSVAIAEVGRGPVGLFQRFKLAVASDADDLLAPATRIVRSISGLNLDEESRLRESNATNESDVGSDQMSWVLEQHARVIEPQIIAEMQSTGELPVVTTWAFPNAPRSIGASTSDRRGPRAAQVSGLTRTTVGVAVAAANAAIRAWASEFIMLPQKGFRRGPLVDRYEELRNANDIHPVEDNTLELALGSLSTAQERWISVAMSFLAHRDWHPGRADGTARPGISPHVLLLLDEPERSLHRSAERDVLARLERLVTEENATAIIATHSPVLLDSDTVVLHHVRMVDDLIALESTDDGGADLTAIAERIGGKRSDVAALHRVFILVEGDADREVLLGLFGDELASIRASVVPMSGTDALHTTVAPFGLLGFTDASVVVLLDHIDHARMTAVQKDAERLLAQRGRSQASRHLRAERFDRNAEKAAVGLLARAIELGELDRVRVVGIPAVDILELIPFELLGCDRSHAEFDVAVKSEVTAGRRWTSKKTKDWLRQGGADISPVGIRRAVGRMDVIPPDLVRIMAEIRAAAKDARPNSTPQDR
jgi:hypothetical protein